MIKIDWTILLQVANFFLLIGALQRFFFRPLRTAMQQRREAWEEQQQKADSLDRRLEERMESDRQRLQELRLLLDQERATVRRELAAETERRLRETEERAALQLEELREQIRQEKDRALAYLQDQTEDLAEGIVRKVIGRPL